MMITGTVTVTLTAEQITNLRGAWQRSNAGEPSVQKLIAWAIERASSPRALALCPDWQELYGEELAEHNDPEHATRHLIHWISDEADWGELEAEVLPVVKAFLDGIDRTSCPVCGGSGGGPDGGTRCQNCRGSGKR